MSGRPDIPGDLRAVAIIHLVMGVGALVKIVVRLTQNHYDLELGVVGIPICFGLLRLSRGWRTCALALLWMGLVPGAVVCLAAVAGSPPATFGVFGISLRQVSSEVLIVVALALLMLLGWEYRVLVRPGVRRLFYPDDVSANTTQQATGAPGGAEG